MRVILNEALTGDFVEELPFTSVTWSSGICQPDSISVSVPGYVGTDVYQYMIPRKFIISVVDSFGAVKASGFLTIPEGDTDDDGNHSVTMPGAGVESIFEHIPVLPYPFWPLMDAEGYPIEARNTRIEGVEYGTMMKTLYKQAMSHPGMTLPLTFEPDRAGSREKGWEAVSGKATQDAVSDISKLIGGVEWDWVPTVDSLDQLSIHLSTATDLAQEITSSYWHTWQSGGNSPDIRQLSVKVSPEFMASTSVFTGGKDEDRVMVSMRTQMDLPLLGIPAKVVWDTSHSSVSEQSTLDEWAAKAISEGQSPIQYWSFDVRSEGSESLRHGDWATIEVMDHWLIPNGSYTRRVVEVSGTDDQDWFGVVVAGEMTW